MQQWMDDMSRLLGGIFAAFLFLTPALAAEADGTIRAVDGDAMTITLDDGRTYKLPGEFDPATLSEGMTVVIAYEEVGDARQITDMNIFD